MTNQEFVQALRDLADFYEARQELKLPTDPRFVLTPSGSEGIAQTARQLGNCVKSTDSLFYRLKRSFGPIDLEAIEYRSQVCEQVVVGRRVVPATRIEAREAEVIPEHEEDIVEWRCPKLLEGDNDGV